MYKTGAAQFDELGCFWGAVAVVDTVPTFAKNEKTRHTILSTTIPLLVQKISIERLTAWAKGETKAKRTEKYSNTLFAKTIQAATAPAQHNQKSSTNDRRSTSLEKNIN